MTLLRAHKILIGAALALALLLVVWGAAHRLWFAMGLGAAVVPLAALYLRKLFRDPPIR